AFLFLAVAPITLAYAVVKHRVFGIRIVIRRGVRYLLARNVLRAVLLLPMALLAGSVLLNPERTVAQILFQHPFHLVLIAAAALVRVMGARAAALEPGPEDAALPAEEREWLSRLAVRLVVPMLTAEGRLVGMILLGEKKSEVPYGVEDRRLLQALAAQIAVL